MAIVVDNIDHLRYFIKHHKTPERCVKTDMVYSVSLEP